MRQYGMPADDQQDCPECRGLGCGWCGGKGWTRDPMPRQPATRRDYRPNMELVRRILARTA